VKASKHQLQFATCTTLLGKFCAEDTALSVLSEMCSKEFASNPECEKVVSQCNNGGCKPTKLVQTMVASAEALSLVNSICNDLIMGSLRDCRRCDRKYDNSNCDVVDVYVALCNTTWLPQCRKHANICFAARDENIELPYICEYFDPIILPNLSDSENSGQVEVPSNDTQEENNHQSESDEDKNNDKNEVETQDTNDSEEKQGKNPLLSSSSTQLPLALGAVFVMFTVCF
jgi:hypothetical protein